MTKNNKIGFKSNANIRDGTIDDVGKLSINDVKKLKDMFGPKRRNPTHKIDRELNIPKDLKDLLFGDSKSNSEPSSKNHNSSGGSGGSGSGSNGSTVPSGMTNNRFNPPMITYDMSNAERFANKSNLDETKINQLITNTINPMLLNFRDEFKPHLENIINDNQKFRNDFKLVKNDAEDYANYLDKKLNYVYDKIKTQSNNNNNIYTDQDGNFATTPGSDYFINNNNKDDDKSVLHLQDSNNNKDDDDVSDLSIPDLENTTDIINNNSVLVDYNDVYDNKSIQSNDNPLMNHSKNDDESYKSIKAKLIQQYFDLGGDDDNILTGKTDIDDIEDAIEEINIERQKQINNETQNQKTTQIKLDKIPNINNLVDNTDLNIPLTRAKAKKSKIPEPEQNSEQKSEENLTEGQIKFNEWLDNPYNKTLYDIFNQPRGKGRTQQMLYDLYSSLYNSSSDEYKSYTPKLDNKTSRNDLIRKIHYLKDENFGDKQFSDADFINN